MNIRDKITVITSWLDDVPNRAKVARKFMDELVDKNAKLSIELQGKVKNLPIADVSQRSELLIAWEQYKKANWYESDAIDVEKMLISQFLAIYSG